MISDAAIQFDGKIYTGRAHGDIILRLSGNIDERVDGFVTDKGLFLNRREAYQHAAQCGQVKPSENRVLASWMLEDNDERSHGGERSEPELTTATGSQSSGVGCSSGVEDSESGQTQDDFVQPASQPLSHEYESNQVGLPHSAVRDVLGDQQSHPSDRRIGQVAKRMSADSALDETGCGKPEPPEDTADCSPRIVQLLMTPQDMTWQNRLIGLGSDGVTYAVSHKGFWEPFVPPLGVTDNDNNDASANSR